MLNIYKRSKPEISIKILSVYTPHKRIPRYMKKKLAELKE
jgi:hypothetical protein